MIEKTIKIKGTHILLINTQITCSRDYISIACMDEYTFFIQWSDEDRITVVIIAGLIGNDDDGDVLLCGNDYDYLS